MLSLYATAALQRIVDSHLCVSTSDIYWACEHASPHVNGPAVVDVLQFGLRQGAPIGTRLYLGVPAVRGGSFDDQAWRGQSSTFVNSTQVLTAHVDVECTLLNVRASQRPPILNVTLAFGTSPDALTVTRSFVIRVACVSAASRSPAEVADLNAAPSAEDIDVHACKAAANSNSSTSSNESHAPDFAAADIATSGIVTHQARLYRPIAIAVMQRREQDWTRLADACRARKQVDFAPVVPSMPLRDAFAPPARISDMAGSQWTSVSYAYSREAAYNEQYATAFFAVDLPKAGCALQAFVSNAGTRMLKWHRTLEHTLKALAASNLGGTADDTTRHYQILAAGTFPFFLGLDNLKQRPLCMFTFPRRLVEEAMALPGVPSEEEVATALRGGRHDALKLNREQFDKAAYCRLQQSLLQCVQSSVTSVALARYVLTEAALVASSRLRVHLGAPHVLILTPPSPDAAAFTLYHGLRRLLGSRLSLALASGGARLDFLYDDFGEGESQGNASELYGRGFGYARTLETPVLHSACGARAANAMLQEMTRRRMEAGYFNVVIVTTGCGSCCSPSSARRHKACHYLRGIAEVNHYIDRFPRTVVLTVDTSDSSGCHTTFEEVLRRFDIHFVREADPQPVHGARNPIAERVRPPSVGAFRNDGC